MTEPRSQLVAAVCLAELDRQLNIAEWGPAGGIQACADAIDFVKIAVDVLGPAMPEKVRRRAMKAIETEPAVYEAVDRALKSGIFP